MKKLIISGICLISIIALAGCTNNDSQTMTALNNQLDRVQSIVASTSVNEISDVSPSITLASNEPYNSIQSFRAVSNENMLREEEIRQKILSKAAGLKSSSNKTLKLGNKKSHALKAISNNLGRYSSQLNETKSQVRQSVSKIKRSLKVSNMNIEEATSSYTTLNNSMNERYAYLCNIYDNLEQACIILECNNTKNNDRNNDRNDLKNIERENECNCKHDADPNDTEDQLEKTKEKGSLKIVKNIDSYTPNNTDVVENNSKITNETNNSVNQQPLPNAHTPQIAPIPNSNNQPLPRPYPYHNRFYPNNGYYGYDRINPGRNTDTYYSFNRNIDTYRFNPSFYNNYFNY